MIENNKLYQIENLFEATEENSITINNCLKQGDLLSRQRHSLSRQKLFRNF